jgi:hypothetical protein
MGVLTFVEVSKVYVASALQVFCPRIKGIRSSANFIQNIVSKYLISAFSLVGDAIWMELGRPFVLRKAFSAVAHAHQFLAVFWTASMLMRVVCFAILAYLGARLALSSAFHSVEPKKAHSPGFL